MGQPDLWSFHPSGPAENLGRIKSPSHAYNDDHLGPGSTSQGENNAKLTD